jgi:soluble lytic murein transglycosylase-like protein
MQLLPDTAGLSRKRLQNPGENLDAGAAYLSKMIDRFDGDLSLALAAYNAGPTKVLSRYVDYHRRLWLESGAAQLVASVS